MITRKNISKQTPQPQEDLEKDMRENFSQRSKETQM